MEPAINTNNPRPESLTHLLPWEKPHPKLMLLNFLEGFRCIQLQYSFSECHHFYKATILQAPGFILDQLANDRPEGVMHHIDNGNHEIFVNID